MFVSALLALTTLGLTPIALRVDREPAASSCPDVDALAARVAARVAGPAIDPHAARLARVQFRAGVRAQIELLDVDAAGAGVVVGARALGPMPADCEALGDAVVLALSLIVDPWQGLAPSSSSSSSSTDAAPADGASADVTATARAIELPRAPVRAPFLRAGARLDDVIEEPAQAGQRPSWWLRGALGTSLGHLPDLATSVAGGIGGGVTSWHGDLDVVLLASLPHVVDDARRIESFAVQARARGCAGMSVGAGRAVDACVDTTLGALRALGVGFTSTVPVVAPIVAPGVSAGFSLPIVRGLDVAIRVGLDVPLVRTQLRSGADVVWETPPVAAHVVLGLHSVRGG